MRKTLAPALLTKGKTIADQYSVVLEPHDRLGFRATAVEFPTVFVHGKTLSECVRKAREALKVAVALMLDQGQAPPLPASDERRDQQINIRLTAEERLLLESAAKRRGFRGISDFMRTTALSETRRSA